MLRSLDEQGGIGVYSRYITESLVQLDRGHEFVLYYRSTVNRGRYAGFRGVTERVVRMPGGKAAWDQVAIPIAASRDDLDVLFHPKFTVPFAVRCPVVMTVHGADWFLPEYARFYSRLDVAYIRSVMPLYFRKAAAVCSVSQITTDDFNRLLRLPPGKVTTTYLAPGPQFRRVTDPHELTRVRQRYRLPDRFIFSLSKLGGGERKNARGLIEAFRHLAPHVPHRLVIGGKDCARFREIYDIPDAGWGAAIDFPGWISQEDLPAVYSLSDLYLYPSNLEAFPIPVVEAMACGVPVLTSQSNGLAEIAGEGAVQVDPNDPEAIASEARDLLTNEARRARVAAAGLERVRAFSWERCARTTLAVLERAAVSRG
ncbi:MAG TPA: glycosyltransferase family 1 protein [Gemmatimonadaceae bacterium]